MVKIRQFWSGKETDVTELTGPEREFFIDSLLVRVHFSIVMIRWTGLAPWESEFPFPGSLASTGPTSLRLRRGQRACREENRA